MSCREGRVDPEMRLAKRTTLCRALQSWFEELTYHTEMQPNPTMIDERPFYSDFTEQYVKESQAAVIRELSYTI